MTAMVASRGWRNGSLYADDTEIYQISGGRPKVLIVIDDSGSMSTVLEGSTRMEIVQDVITESDHRQHGYRFWPCWNSTVIRRGENYHGGRIISRIIADMTDEQRSRYDRPARQHDPPEAVRHCVNRTYEAYRTLPEGPLFMATMWQRDNS